MKYIINVNDESPAYLQLYRQLRQDIVDGIYPLNSKLPSKRMLAEEVDVSTVTVEHAIALLCEEGYVEARERSGYFIIFRTDAGFAGAAVSAGVKNYSQPTARGGTGEFPFSVLARTMRGVLSSYGEEILERSPNSGRSELREALGQYLARSRGIAVSPDQIIVGSGSEYLYNLIVGLLGRKRIYAIESPSYKKIEQIYSASGVTYEMLPLGRDGIDSRALWESGADVLHISPYRSFPSGVSASASKRHEYLKWAKTGNRHIIEDDFESEFSLSKKPEETLFSHTKDENVIYMNSFSMTVSPAIRVGYMVLPAGLVRQYSEKMGFYSCTVPTFEQLVLAELIANGDFERHINRVRRKKRKSADI
ncbi:MAG: PLP-dependent aminotransferase family protein [Clostridia bacterium]|nr:PLP-dependent aminotransferase family protein [Clostridia bacterium]